MRKMETGSGQQPEGLHSWTDPITGETLDNLTAQEVKTLETVSQQSIAVSAAERHAISSSDARDIRGWLEHENRRVAAMSDPK